MIVAASHQDASRARALRIGLAPATEPAARAAAWDTHALSSGTRRTNKRSGFGIGIDWDRSGSFLETGVEEAIVIGGQAFLAAISATGQLIHAARQHLAGRLQSYRIW